MKRLKVVFLGDEISLWDFAGLQLKNTGPPSHNKVKIDVRAKAKRLDALIETLTDVEAFLN